MSRDLLFSLQAEARSFQAAMQASAAQLRRFSADVQGAAAAARRLGPASKGAASGAEALKSTITATATAITAATQTMQLMGRVAQVSFDVVRSAVEGTVGSFAEFDAGVRSVAAALGSANLSGIGAQITELGIASEFTIGQVQQGALALAQLGATEKTLRPLLDTAIKIAGVTRTDVATAAEIARKQMNAFGLSVAELPRLSTQLIQASTKSAATMERLAVALQFAGPAAAGVGQGLRDVLPAIEALSDAGFDASIAGTSIRNVFTQLLNPTASARKALRELGLSAEELSPTSNTLIQIIEKLGNANLDAARSVQIFGKRFGLNTLKLTQMTREGRRGADALRVYQRELDNVAEAERKVATIRSGLDFSLKQLRASFDAARTQLGAFAVEMLGLDKRAADAAQRVSALVAGLSNLTSGEFREVVVKLVGQKDIAGIFAQAVDRMGPPLARVFTAAATFGARQLTTLAPLVGAGLAKTFLVGTAATLPRIVSGAGALFVQMLGGAGVALVQALTAASKAVFSTIAPIINGAASLLGYDEPIKVDRAVRALERTSEKLQLSATRMVDTVTAGLTEAGAMSGKALAREASRVNLGSTGELLRDGRKLADDLFGNSGTFDGLRAAGMDVANLIGQQVDRFEQLTVRGRIRALPDRAGDPRIDALIAGFKLLDLSQRDPLFQRQAAEQFRQQEAAARKEREAAEQRAAEDRRRREQQQQQQSQMAFLQQRLQPAAAAGGGNTTVVDRSVNTNYGARSRERVVGPRKRSAADGARVGLFGEGKR